MIRNFFNTLRRFQMSSALNILGLSVAFAAFMLIMVQVKWDLTYDAGHPGSDRIYRLETNAFAQPGDKISFNAFMSRPIGEKMANLSPRVDVSGCIGAWDEKSYYTINGGQQPDRQLTKIMMSSGIIDVFDLEAAQGDFKRFREEPYTVILSQKEAKNIFGDANPIDRQLYGQRDTLTVVAVFKDLPENSYLSYLSNFFINIRDIYLNNNGEWGFQYYVKLKSPTDHHNVQNEAKAFIKERLPNGDFETRLMPLTDIYYYTSMISDQYPKGNKSTTYLLIAIACLVLGIAVINFVNFFVAMVPIRIRSINISKVFGAPTFKLRTILVFEAVAMMLLSAIVGVGIVWMCSETPITEYISGSIDFPAIWPVVWGTLCISLVVGFVSGLFPAIYITSFPAVMVLRGAFGRSRAGQRLRVGLVGLQYVISVAMIICAIFVNMQTSFLQNHDMGYNRDNLLHCNVGQQIGGAKRGAFVDRIKSNPSIVDVAFTDGLLASEAKMVWARVYKGKEVSFNCFLVSPNFPKFMGMKVVEGRDFVAEDDNKPGTYLFNRKAQKTYNFVAGELFEGHDTIPATIAGVVEDFNFASMQYAINPLGLYVMGGGSKWRELRDAYFRVSPDADIEVVKDYIEQVVKEMNPEMVEVEVNDFNESLTRLYAKENRLTGMISMFSGLAIIISLMGVFGLVLFETQYRRKEIGVRKIHGSTVVQILVMFNRRFVWIVAGAFAVAVPMCIWGLNWWLNGFAYRTPMHWWVFLVGGLAILAITVVTVTIQSYRSATENPVKCLKTE